MERLSLDALAADPSLAEKLPVEALAALSLQTAAVQAAIASALIKRNSERDHDDGGDRLLTVPEAAKLLAVTPGYLYRNARRLKLAIKLSDGALRFRRERLLEFIREQA